MNYLSLLTVFKISLPTLTLFVDIRLRLSVYVYQWDFTAVLRTMVIVSSVNIVRRI